MDFQARLDYTVSSRPAWPWSETFSTNRKEGGREKERKKGRRKERREREGEKKEGQKEERRRLFLEAHDKAVVLPGRQPQP